MLSDAHCTLAPSPSLLTLAHTYLPRLSTHELPANGICANLPLQTSLPPLPPTILMIVMLTISRQQLLL